MKVFISWSGKLSKSIAEILKDKLPSIIQTIVPFFSETDIDKGEIGGARIRTELADTKFCIVCLTHENVTAPWINFEAGAISQQLEKKISALMIGLQPSDIQGPLADFQGTKVAKNDFFALVQSINNSNEKAMTNEQLQKAFDFVWPSLEAEIKDAMAQCQDNDSNETQEADDTKNIAIEEILSLVRRQNAMLSNPEKLFPADYLREIIGTANISGRMGAPSTQRIFLLITEILRWLERVLEQKRYFINNDNHELMSVSEIESMLNLIEDNSRMFGFGQSGNIDVRISRLKIIAAGSLEEKERNADELFDFLEKLEIEKRKEEIMMQAKALSDDNPQN